MLSKNDTHHTHLADMIVKGKRAKDELLHGKYNLLPVTLWAVIRVSTQTDIPFKLLFKRALYRILNIVNYEYAEKERGILCPEKYLKEEIESVIIREEKLFNKHGEKKKGTSLTILDYIGEELENNNTADKAVSENLTFDKYMEKQILADLKNFAGKNLNDEGCLEVIKPEFCDGDENYPLYINHDYSGSHSCDYWFFIKPVYLGQIAKKVIYKSKFHIILWAVFEASQENTVAFSRLLKKANKCFFTKIYDWHNISYRHKKSIEKFDKYLEKQILSELKVWVNYESCCKKQAKSNMRMSGSYKLYTPESVRPFIPSLSDIEKNVIYEIFCADDYDSCPISEIAQHLNLSSSDVRKIQRTVMQKFNDAFIELKRKSAIE